MKHLDHLPTRHRNHEIEAAAVLAFETLVAGCVDVIIQGRDRTDYGVDVQVEVVDRSHPTNARIQVQLKGTEQPLNADGSVSVSVDRANLNYLLNQPYSLFVCLHRPTGSLRVCSAEAVARRYEHAGVAWTGQDTLTVNFVDLLDIDRLRSLARLAGSSASASRNARFTQAVARPEDLAAVIRNAMPDVHVPDDPRAAAHALQGLFHSRIADKAISAAFDRFFAVLGPDHRAMSYAYMSEINLGMDGLSSNPDRLNRAVAFLTSMLGTKAIPACELHYCIGNAHTALHQNDEAAMAFEMARNELSADDAPGLRAQILKNLGDTRAGRGDTDSAISLYREALALDPTQPEAHHALGHHALRVGDYADALHHFDQIVFEDDERRQSSVPGWRVNALFNLGEGRAAFREIFALLAHASDKAWIWPWSAQQVRVFGRSNDENARQSLTFWDRYLKASPSCPGGTGERLMTILYLRRLDDYQGPNYATFKIQFEAGIGLIAGENAAFLWDRLGHWAEDEENWGEAQHCFRKAYDLAGGEYGYCLGMALNSLGRHEEAEPILLEQAEHIQPDDKSWCELASAYLNQRKIPAAEDAYERAIELNPDNASAWFDLGGLYWNAGRRMTGIEIWTEAITRFPDSEPADRLRKHLPQVFGDESDGDPGNPAGSA
jgi:tetratricopeptide (TPR) repeat protein